MRYLFISMLLSSLLLAGEFIAWQPYHAKNKKASHQEHNTHSGRKAKQFEVNNFNPFAQTEAYYLMPTLEKRELSFEDGHTSLPRTGMENYHALVLIQSTEETIQSSVRYLYSHGRPSKTSPTKITQYHKSRLEIEPVLLPKEHNHYKGSNSYDFRLRFDDNRLGYHPITLTTSNGTTLKVESDEGGRFQIKMPNDFKEVKMKRRANRPAEFILSASYSHEGINYSTTLAMPYHVNPLDYWHEQTFAIVLVFLGIMMGIFMFRNIHKTKKRKA